MRWPWQKRVKRPIRGVRVGEFKVKAPLVDASDEQWLDFSALCGMFVLRAFGQTALSATSVPDEWCDRAAKAYRNKWGLE